MNLPRPLRGHDEPPRPSRRLHCLRRDTMPLQPLSCIPCLCHATKTPPLPSPPSLWHNDASATFTMPPWPSSCHNDDSTAIVMPQWPSPALAEPHRPLLRPPRTSSTSSDNLPTNSELIPWSGSLLCTSRQPLNPSSALAIPLLLPYDLLWLPEAATALIRLFQAANQSLLVLIYLFMHLSDH